MHSSQYPCTVVLSIKNNNNSYIIIVNYLYYYKIVLQGLRRNLSTTRRRGHGDDDEAGLEMRIHLRPKFLQVKKLQYLLISCSCWSRTMTKILNIIQIAISDHSKIWSNTWHSRRGWGWTKWLLNFFDLSLAMLGERLGFERHFL